MESLELRSSQDIIRARLAARELVAATGLGAMDQTRFATAVSELCRNVLIYAGTGNCHLSNLSDDRRIRIEARVVDEGPGIPDIELAMQDGYSTSRGLGAGLPGARRLVDQFEIQSTPAGTQVCVQIVVKRRS